MLMAAESFWEGAKSEWVNNLIKLINDFIHVSLHPDEKFHN